MLNIVKYVALSLVIACISSSVAIAEKAPAADPEKVKADPDFTVQGEYAGEVKIGDDQRKYGVHIIALGDGKFRAVAYPGGLPGEGWDVTRGRPQTESQIVNGIITFKDPESTIVGQIKNGMLVTSDPNDASFGGSFPKVIRKSPTLGLKPPQGAKVLFGGKDANDFPANKITEDDLLMQGSNSRSKFQSCTLHLEFMLPFEPKGRGQGRGNSGCYLQGRYEVQILDSFGLEGKNNECGGIYTVGDPIVNMCYPPMQWQTYDIDFTAAQFDAAGKKIKNARMTVKHNGVVVQNDVEVDHATTAAPNKEGPEAGFLHLQDHGHPVRFRNIWIVEK